MNSLQITGRSPLLMQALNAAVQAAPYDVTVLVTGENGTGKDYFYKILHNGSNRRFKKCIAVNCGGLPEGTIDSELFGHVKGAYTGSVGDRKGYFEEADGGTIFLDEVGDLPMSIQAKLLRVLEKGEIIRMGSNDVRKVNVRVVAATNVNLEKAIREGRFRQDLYFRLSTINIHVPALRERPEDIPLLFKRFSNDIAAKYHMTEGIRLTEDAQKLLLAYQWPGNIRQLLHIVEEISIVEPQRLIDGITLQKYLPKFASGVSVGGATYDAFAPGEKGWTIAAILSMQKDLEEIRVRLGLKKPSPVAASRTLPSSSPIVSTPADGRHNNETNKFEEVEEAQVEEIDVPSTQAAYTPPPSRPRTMDEIEKEAILDALRRNKGNKQKAAEELKISPRTIHRKLGEYGIQDADDLKEDQSEPGHSNSSNFNPFDSFNSFL